MQTLLQYVHDLAPVVFLAGLYGLCTSLLAWRRGVRAAAWPGVEGRVVQSRVKKGKSGASDMGHGNNPKTTTYKARVKYSYEVRGVSFTGERVQFGTRKYETIKTVAEKSASDFVVGQPVTIYYDPQKPERSVLKPGVDSFWKKRMTFAGALLVIGTGGWFASL